MYFTREPIIETIISPREGYKLVLRSSKHEKQEEFYVDSVEVVNFGNHSFYRSIDRNVTFLLPVFDYEIVETRSARLAVKASAPPQEKEIRIGKAKEADSHHAEEKKKEKRSARKKKDKSGQRDDSQQQHIQQQMMVMEESLVDVEDAPKPKAEISMPRALIPPPTTLISDSLSRYAPSSPKEQVVPVVQETKESFGIDEESEDLDTIV